MLSGCACAPCIPRYGVQAAVSQETTASIQAVLSCVEKLREDVADLAAAGIRPSGLSEDLASIQAALQVLPVQVSKM